MALPANVGTGTVIGHYIDGHGDPIDGNVTFTPSVKKLLNVTAIPPTTILPKPVTVPIAAGSFSATLIATDDPDDNPTGWTWEVSIVPTGAGAEKLEVFHIAVPEGTTVDLTIEAPVAKSNGVPIVRGVGIPDPATATNGQVVTWDTPTSKAIWADSAGGAGGSVAWADVTGKPATFTPATHTHVVGDVTGLQTALDGKATSTQGAKADTAVQPGSLATVATSGSAADLTGTLPKPVLPALAKADVGLGSVDNTADSAKAFSASQITGGTFSLARLAPGSVIATSDTIRPTSRTDVTVLFTGADPGVNALSGDMWVASP